MKRNHEPHSCQIRKVLEIERLLLAELSGRHVGCVLQNQLFATIRNLSPPLSPPFGAFLGSSAPKWGCFWGAGWAQQGVSFNLNQRDGIRIPLYSSLEFYGSGQLHSDTNNTVLLALLLGNGETNSSRSPRALQAQESHVARCIQLCGQVCHFAG